MKPNYSLDDMRLFWVVAEAGSFRQAATVLGIPPSTLSRRINALEQTLGLRLLHRDAHRINLTGTGRQYFERCGPLFSELNDISGELHAEKHEPAGVLRIAAPVNTMYRWLAAALNQFQLRYPKIDLDIRMSNWMIDVGEHAIDLAIRVGEPRLQGWIARPLTLVQSLLCASNRATQWHHIQHPSELINYPLVVSSPINVWRFIHQQDQQQIDYSPQGNIRLSVDDMNIAMQAIEAGVGIGYLPRRVVQEYIQQGRLVALATDWQGPKRDTYLLYRDRDNQPLRLRLLIEHLLEVAPKEY
ncbi:LysR family transcriptional regulator [Rheinheimera sp.]|jgi:LysR family transcriptional regulator AphB|uniref:LysR family transcriptional regulator n=1 Tax=Rheinheimera sp. TaxID=1869214 RepID=UPI00262BF7BD|nr:LysR family transcriptional regulator [Rheinheimera sp.]MCA1929700.1 LysR family transcriptional regulator [Rheinheimera sp.]